ncbi:L-tyrosine/L-tryptophan isonitrile synthase family protein [Bacteriovorax sp. PP10]|uniref:L-tyrosine/L-tryptophan isonitrile synthase family protein n=1 Tax=Bacteriovorax antarcticus TaxID=3088717 RepID=A0ABU5VSL8_9BACT|nr:L-tyrosine/L-tryptophan isonitrile synthase family protein [Bacteriovorax sp. PP10]MEA9356049.1 L-tyrosine/L-tryptophan isonitrile synthase family protein [Bacteriovorax sp. PP10]
MMELSNENLEDLSLAISTACKELSKLSNHGNVIEDYYQIPIMQKIEAQMVQRKTLQFLLPAFPAKSPSPLKTAGHHPDLGEVLALNNLNEMCKKITSLYEPGAEVIICSDGRIFSDVVMVSDKIIDEYSEWIKSIIIEFDLKHLSTFAMDDIHQEMNGPELRERLVWQYAKSLDEVRFLVINDDDFRGLFNGVHKFMLEDQMGLPENATISKNQLNKKTKLLTYELIRRSDAWSTLLLDYFDDSLRLSIHAYPLTHEKFGVKLVHSSEKWATPWHNVTVKKGEQFELMHLSEAEKLGAKKELFRGKYVYFQA